MAIKDVFTQLWTPDYLIPANREDELRINLRKLCFYLLFLALYSAVIFHMMPPIIYTFTVALKKQFIFSGFECRTGNIITFRQIQTASDVWKYLQSVMVDSFYSEYWYSNDLKIKRTDPDDNKVLYENAFLGTPRIRQLRVANDSCIIHDNFKKTFASCYAYYSFLNEDRSSFRPINATSQESAWIYHSAGTFAGVPYFGVISMYPQGGYYHDLSLNRNETMLILDDLQKNFWITRHTRVIFVDFSLYNANVNVFSVIKLVFEFPPTGGVIPSSYFSSHKFIRYVSTGDFVIIGCEIICILFILAYTANEVRYWMYYKTQRFRFFWTYVDAVFLFFAYFGFIGTGFRIYFIGHQIQTIEENPNIYLNFDSALAIRNFSNNCMAIDIFICWVKVFKFLNLSRTMAQLRSLLKMCWRDIFGFSLMFFVIFLAFAQMGYLLFGAQIKGFSTFGTSVMTLLITILGEFDYYEIERTNKVLAPIFFTSYIFFVFFVLFNMFLAIITDTYSDIKSELKLKKSEVEISEFFCRAPRAICRKLGSKEKKRPKKTAAGKEFISRITEILELCGLTELEIEVFLTTNNVHHTKNFTDEDIEKLMAIIRKEQQEDSDEFDGMDQKTTSDLFSMQQQRLETLNEDIQKLHDTVELFKTKQ